MRSDVIFDIGMHNGQDSEFYLRKGFNVVAIEANPLLAQQTAQRLGRYIRFGRFTLLNVGLAHETGELPFYINEQIDEWSSFNREIASRGHPVKEIIVPTMTVADLIDKHGVPYYAKVDIEGLDGMVIDGLVSGTDKPVYVSYENPMPHIFERLVEAGYKRFKNVSQARVQEYSCPNPPREGKYVKWRMWPFKWTFMPGSSGPFGEETPGPWLTAEEMRPVVDRIERERLEALEKTIYPEWFDMHAGL